MGYDEFKEALVEELQRSLGNDGTVRVDKIVGKNDIQQDSFSISLKNSNIEPRFYFPQLYTLYERAYPVGIIASNILNEAKRAIYDYNEIPVFSKEGAKDNLYCVVMNLEQNKEYLKHTPYEKFQDLAIVPRYRLDIEDNSSVLVTHDMCVYDLKMTDSEVLEQAMKNTEKMNFECKNMVDEIKDMLAEKDIPFDEIQEALDIVKDENRDMDLYIVSTPNRIDGAVAIACPSVMESVANQIGGDYYILPSSRHELMVLKDDGLLNLEDLKDLLVEGNRYSVSKSDFLSDNVYHYDSLTKKITIADSPVLEKTAELIETPIKNHHLTH